MERSGGTQATELTPVDPVGEWAAPGGGTGLEEPMWQLGLGGGPESYPERPDDPDCIYYLRTGFCGYGSRCRFNHPRDRSLAMGSLRNSGVDYPERIGQPVCQYYMRTGMCKFGGSCKYHHPKYGVGSSPPIMLNFYGYPLKPGEKECSHYMRTGQCKFGMTCKFHHPQPEGIQAPAPAPMPTHALYPSLQSSQQYRIVPGNWPMARPAIHGYGPMIFPPGVVPVPGWTPYPAPVNPMASPNAQPTIGAGPIYGIPQLPPPPTAYAGPYVPITSSYVGPSSSSIRMEHAFPERPGQPECQFYLRTGDCKFGSACKYHHPREWSAPDMPVAPYPVGSTSLTLVPSSSSSGFRPLSAPQSKVQDSGPGSASSS